ncbi:DUF2642 domain-containing protein [Camelliibacillus cellulosilyticus]|uniref:DUF2642 domain-containing protein n=1 Tax=Camelliibacillus cellulosilyticus TaxID=2174486 RepID=A0ABV9GMD9_9BACL
MIHFKKYVGEPVEVTISGHYQLSGILIDAGTDLLILYNGEDFIYIPGVHIHYTDFQYVSEEEISEPDDVPFQGQNESISFRKILNNAKGMFSEINITGNETIHGYVTHVLNDYFTFYSPVYKTMFIPLHHLKYLIPYHTGQRPYALDKEALPLSPSNVALSRTFEEQCRKHVGDIIIFDLGHDPKKVGQLVKVENGQVEMIIARDQSIYLNMHHIKAVHMP